jgi:hypothetical protein
MNAPTRPRWRAWSGLVIGSDLNFYDCHAGRGWLPAAVGVAALLVTVAAGLLSWSERRNPPPASFIALLGTMAAGLLALTIAIQIGAALIVPACFR